MKTITTTLENGITLLKTRLPDSNSITIVVLIRAGAAEEEIPGLAHVLEHMVFKGTMKRPSAYDINTEIETVGGYLNAATSQEFTEYYIKIPCEFYEKAFDMLSDILINSVFDEKELRKEQDVIVEEINMYEDMPIRSVSDSFYSLVWPKNTLGRSITGTPETVRSITREDMVLFARKHYIPKNIMISVAGAFDESRIDTIAQDVFGVMKEWDVAFEKELDGHDNLSFFNEGKEVTLMKEEHINMRFEERNTKQSHFCFGVEALSYKQNVYPLEVASGILAEGSSSYLWQKIREDLGASYYLNSEIDSFSTTGIWYIHAGVDTDKLGYVLEIISEAFQKLQRKDVSEEELTRAKEYIKGDFVMNLEGSEEIARYMAHEFFEHGSIKTVEEEKACIDAVTLDEIGEITKKLYSGNIYFNTIAKYTDLKVVKNAIHV